MILQLVHQSSLPHLPPHCQYIRPETASEVEALIENLGLEWFGRVEKVEEGESST